MVINILDEALINKIAAGEVIERPASVVKELVENSIDAEATKIFVEVREGGKSYIKISDDGHGMSFEDARLSVFRHATSKISKADDLFNINTLGFRGEALASIAAVADLKLVTKTKDSMEGTLLEISNGKTIKHENIGCPDGTAIEVSNLFINTPVRKKFLKSMQIELKNIIDIISRYALARPNIYFRLVHNGKLSINSPGTSDTLANVTSIYGRELARDLLVLDYSNGDIEIMGFISRPSYTRSDKQHQSFFVNGRYIKDEIITSALHDAYQTMLMTERYPVAILDVKINPQKIDVNVHPTKDIIRVEQQKDLYTAIFEAVRDTLEKNNLIPEVNEKEINQIFVNNVEKLKQANFDIRKTRYSRERQQVLETVEQDIKALDELKVPDMKILGQVNRTYIVTEYKDGLSIIDQHAAQERVNFEKFLARFNKKSVQVQRLVEPVILELSPLDSSVITDNLGLFRQFGFNIEEFGNNSYIIRTIPTILNKVQNKQLILDLIDEILALDELKTKIDKDAYDRLCYLVCRASVKAGEELTMPQMKDIVQSLHLANNPYTCPHGRPTMINLSIKDLEKKFKRIV